MELTRIDETGRCKRPVLEGTTKGGTVIASVQSRYILKWLSCFSDELFSKHEFFSKFISLMKSVNINISSVMSTLLQYVNKLLRYYMRRCLCEVNFSKWTYNILSSVMGQAESTSDPASPNPTPLGTFQDKLARHALDIKQAATISYPFFLESLQELNKM
jgi:hypothetical protein